MKLAKSRLISVILIFLLIFSSTVTAFADEEAAEDKEAKKQEEQIQAKKEAEKKAAEEKARKEAEAKAAEEKARKEAEEKAAEEKAKKEAEEKAAEEKAKKEAEEKASAEKTAEDKTVEDAEDDASEKADEPKEASDSEAEQEGAEQETLSDAAEKAESECLDQEQQGLDDKAKNSLKLQDEEGLSDGTYKADDFSFTGGTGKAYMTLDRVIIKNSKATAILEASAETMTHIYMGTAPSSEEYTPLYDPDTDTCGEDVYGIYGKKVAVPAVLNSEEKVSVRTTAMSRPHWVGYKYKITLSDQAEKTSDDTTIPDFKKEAGSDPGTDDTDPEPEEPEDTTDTKTLKDGTYKVKATTDRKMFYLYPKEKDPATVVLVKKNGKMTATITLTGSGYDYVYMGTPAQAKKAGKKNWIKYKKVDGYYTFKIPVAKLDKKLNITPHSSKYENDGDPSTDPWRPDKWIKFYSKGAKKVKDGSTIKTKGKAKNRNAGTQTSAKEQKKWADAAKKGTSAVNNSTGLKDGTYKPDRFNWSGGSGRLAYIRCNKITVKGGKAYATIEFGSSKYDALKASGHTYHKSGGGNSKFTIPVKLNANNLIIGRTTAMSQPHWIAYSIFIYKKGAGAGKNGDSEEGDDGHVTSTKKLSSKAPDLLGLEFKEEVKVEYAEYFKIYKYEQGITLIEIDQAADTALCKEDSKDSKSSGTSDSEEDESQGHVEYDEEGNIVAKSQNEIVDDLYHNNIVNYIVVPDGVEIPAGLDKDGIILQQPIERSFVASEKAADVLEQLGLLDKVKTVGFDAEESGIEALKKALEDESMAAAGSFDKPDYAALVKSKADMGIFPSVMLPEKLRKDASAEEEEESEEKVETLDVIRKRFSALGIPMMIDRSDDEKTNYASAEWIKVYGAVFGKDDEAAGIFDKYVAENKKVKNED